MGEVGSGGGMREGPKEQSFTTEAEGLKICSVRG